MRHCMRSCSKVRHLSGERNSHFIKIGLAEKIIAYYCFTTMTQKTWAVQMKNNARSVCTLEAADKDARARPSFLSWSLCQSQAASQRPACDLTMLATGSSRVGSMHKASKLWLWSFWVRLKRTLCLRTEDKSCAPQTVKMELLPVGTSGAPDNH